MGCVLSSEAIEADLEHAPPDFDRTADPKRTFMHWADFSCRFEPAVFGELFKQQSSIISGRFALPRLAQDKDKYEDGYDMFLIRPYRQLPLAADIAFRMLATEFQPMEPQDVGTLQRYVFCNKTRAEMLSAREFIRFAYLCYRFRVIITEPPLALFYYLDDHHSGYASVKRLRQIIGLHYKISKPQKTLFHTPRSYCNIEEFQQAIAVVQRQHSDPMKGVFSHYNPRDFPELDLELAPLTAWEREFSDVSVGKDKALKIRRLKKRAAELKWTEEDLEEAIERTTKLENWEETADNISDQIWQR